ncbi:MAG: hypothetical protein KKC03_13250 [Bacteroidetes bacterium]|nr:hypothetical protein [Bacteroidota bacterium]
MPKIAYTPKRFGADALALVAAANRVIEEYQADDLRLTLRQLFYQLVSAATIPNDLRTYKRLGSVISDARLAGLVDWSAIEDRDRELHTLGHWESAESILRTCARQFRVDRWVGQPFRPEVWVEKNAMLNVLERACEPLDVPYMSCKGYPSQTALWESAQRMMEHLEVNQVPVVVHLGDHDPSGIDMTRDITDRISLFLNYHGHKSIRVDRVALNMDQVEQYSPPPNPAKMTDSRFEGYMAEFGESSWELDALNVRVLVDLIQGHVRGLMDPDLYDERGDLERVHKEGLSAASDRWDDVLDYLGVE